MRQSSENSREDVDVDYGLQFAPVAPLRRIGSGPSIRTPGCADELRRNSSNRFEKTTGCSNSNSLWRSDDWNRLHDSDYLHAAWLAAVRYPIRNYK